MRRLLLDRLGDRPLVVLAEEHHRRVEDAGVDERLVDVALAGRAVTEVGDDRALGAVLLHAHGVAGRVQRLGADDDRVEVEVLLVRVPAAVVHAAEQAQQVERVDAAAPGDAVLAVGREGVVVVAHARGRSRPGRPPGRAGWPRCPARPGAAARWPRRRPGGPATRSRYRPRSSSSVRSTEYVGCSTPLALRREQLHELRIARRGRGERRHRDARPAPADSAVADSGVADSGVADSALALTGAPRRRRRGSPRDRRGAAAVLCSRVREPGRVGPARRTRGRVGCGSQGETRPKVPARGTRHEPGVSAWRDPAPCRARPRPWG